MDFRAPAAYWRLAAASALSAASFAMGISDQFGVMAAADYLTIALAVFSLIAIRYGFIALKRQTNSRLQIRTRLLRGTLYAGISACMISAVTIAWRLAYDTVDVTGAAHGLALIVCIAVFEILSSRLIATANEVGRNRSNT